MRFNRYAKAEPYQITPRKLAAARRAVQCEKSRLVQRLRHFVNFMLNAGLSRVLLRTDFPRGAIDAPMPLWQFTV